MNMQVLRSVYLSAAKAQCAKSSRSAPRLLAPGLIGLLLLSSLFSSSAAVRLTPLQGGHWPDFASGQPVNVVVDNHYAYIGLRNGGLVIADITNPTNCVRLGGYDSGGDWAGG